MKKILLMVVMAMITIAANAEMERGWRMGVQINGGSSSVCADSESAFGYGLGWIAEYNFSPTLYISSGLGLQDIAHKTAKHGDTYNAYFAQIPAQIGYRALIGYDSAIFVQAGPTFGIGLFGSSDYFNGGKRFDLGMGGRVGIEFKRLQLSAGVNYGVLPAFQYYTKPHNLSINAGLALMF